MKNNLLNLEFNLVKFPIIFPIIYVFILYIFPQFETYLLFFTILFLAETHFGATWPFFLNKSNSKFISDNKVNLLVYPFLIIIFSLFGFIFFKNLFLLIFFAVNMFHVTRQSFGICKLYTKNNNEIKFQSFIIYFFNILFFLIGYFRFYVPIINSDYLIYLNIIILLLVILSLFFYYNKFNKENIFIFLTGIIIFYPICFVSNPVHSIIMGVTMHYTQYLYLTHKVHEGRKKNKLSTNSYYYFFVIFSYAFVMALLSLAGKSSNEIFSMLIIIPITGQMLHFYLDSQLWKFSNHHNRENVLYYLKD